MPEKPTDREEESEKLKKSPEYRRFKKLLKQVVKAPPLKRRPSSPNRYEPA
jgi:hypothetical protein